MGAVQRIHNPDALRMNTMAVIGTLLGEHRVIRPQTRQAISQKLVGLTVALVPEPVGGPPLSHRTIPDLE